MKRIKLLTVVGARPQFIKASALSSEVLKHDLFEEVIIHTGQHFDTEMSDIFFNELGIPKPKFNLGVGGGSHGENTGKMIIELEKVFITEQPSAVVLYGDTDSTLAGAIAASKLHIPVVHIEAGLRSFNKRMPEEINRILTDHVSSILFTPSASSQEQLLAEGVSSENICISGDIMFDATLKFGRIAKQQASKEVRMQVDNNSKYALLTLHRAENVDYKERFESILNNISLVEFPVLFPIHPRTANRLEQFNLNLPTNVVRLDPVGYFSMLYLEKNSSVILTDSGGVQKEAFFSKVPCVTLRDETEWVELIDLGVNFIVGDNMTKFTTAISKIEHIDKSVYSENIYGNGTSSLKILNFISSKLG